MAILNLEENLLLDTDSYKAGHYLQYPPGTDSMFSYIESRGGKYPHTVFFGLQYILKRYLSKPITVEMVEEANDFFEEHGEPFNYEGWMYIAKDLNGKLPIRIRALPEGSIVPTHNMLVSVESTDPKAFWVVSYLETMLLRIWYPITVATQSNTIRSTIAKYLNETSTNPLNEELAFKLHDFGSRGVSSSESAGIGGLAHLVNFFGSDTVQGVVYGNRYYNSKMAGYSIPASEHSSITSWGKSREVEAYRNMLKQFAKPGALVACVSDSYDLFNACENLWGEELKAEIINSGATLVVRPDSGDPATVVLKTLQILDSKFGSTVNAKGFKVLNHVRVIQGDGINQESIEEILGLAKKHGFSATNIAFGMGGALLQQVNRDTQKFAMKCSSVTIDGEHVDVFKDPVTDNGKRSKPGRLDVVLVPEEMKDGKPVYRTVRLEGNATEAPNTAMQTVYLNGEVLVNDNLDIIRVRVNEAG